MAFSDFDQFGTQSTQVHSAAPLTTNPLSSGGSFCRRFDNTFRKLYFTTSSYGGSFYNIPNTKVISARACLRGEGSNGIFLSVKDPASFASNNNNGYRFGFNGGNGRFQLDGNDNTLLISANNWSSQTWYSLRMDVFPISTTADRIICYIESSPGSGVWNNTVGGTVFDITVASSDSKYVSWSNNGRCGVWCQGNSGAATYVDNIDFQVFNAP